LVVFIRHDSAEVWGVVIGTLKIMASTGVFVHVVCALKRLFSGFSSTPRMILTLTKHNQSRSYQKNDLSKDFSQVRRRREETERQSGIAVYWIKLNT
jgi:hypothetical protein